MHADLVMCKKGCTWIIAYITRAVVADFIHVQPDTIQRYLLVNALHGMTQTVRTGSYP
jgi:hypothetical protein